MVAIEAHKAVDYLRRLLSDIMDAQTCLGVTSGVDLLTGFWTLMSQSPQPSAYVRALLQSLLGRHGRLLGRYPLEEFVRDDLCTLTSPAELVSRVASIEKLSIEKTDIPPRQRDETKRRMDHFFSRCSQSYQNIFKACCLNRSRVRRTLCHAAVEWDQNQADAEDVDSALQAVLSEQPISYPPGAELTYSFCLSSWTYHYKLLILEMIILMGFELSVYDPREFACMYWFLAHLCNIHLAHLERISFFASQRNTASTRKDRMAGKATKDAEELDETLRQLYRSFRRLKTIEAFAKALHGLHTVIDRHGQSGKTKMYYTAAELRYELRMRPFLQLSLPEPLTFEEFSQLSDLSHITDVQILENAAKHCSEAKRGWEEMLKDTWNARQLVDNEMTNSSYDNSQKPDSPHGTAIEREWRKDMQCSMKASIAASIAISSLKRMLAAEDFQTTPRRLGIRIPDVGDRERWHAWWAVPVTKM